MAAIMDIALTFLKIIGEVIPQKYFTHDYTDLSNTFLGNLFSTRNGGDIEQNGEPIEANKLARYSFPL